MAKETVRYPDALVARIEEVVAEADAFESKSEFHRFASDFLLSVLDPEHDPSVLGYGDILADLESTAGGRLVPQGREGEEGETAGPFLDAYIQVRRHLLYDDAETARAVVTDRYDATDREALLLDEVIGRARRSSVADSDRTRQHELPSRDHVRQPEATSRPPGEGREEDRREGGHEDLVETNGTTTDGETTAESEETAAGREMPRRRAEATQETDGGVDPEDA